MPVEISETGNLPMTRKFLRMDLIARFTRSLSSAGLLLGSLFFAASLAPSLIPRTFVVQGVLSGISFAAGYGLGVGARWLWIWLGLPLPRARTATIWLIGASAVCIAIIGGVLWRASEWHDSVRQVMGMDPVQGSRPLEIAAIATAVFAAIILLARVFGLLRRALAGWLSRHVPPRVSNIVGVAIAVVLTWTLVNGVLLRFALHTLDGSYQQLDELVESEVERPRDPLRTGSNASLIAWEGMGRRGREYVNATPSREEISAFLGVEAAQPVRVYVGLNSGETVEERARLALEELVRVGGFERAVLLIATPTGTGWLDPNAIETLEYLHRGDVATVSMQYSYLASHLALLIEPGYGAESARALFREVYGYWTQLPREERPRLYLHGVSLGAMNSDLSSDLWDIIADPFHGALWAGPPFGSPTWRSVTEERVPGSHFWLPRFRDGSIVRFFNQDGPAEGEPEPWGPVRIVYLQYASDPIPFFDSRAAWREPQWMAGERGPDVSPMLRWFPVVTLFHLMVDVAMANHTPIGFGHTYAPDDYIDAWIAVTDPIGWNEAAVGRLKARFSVSR